MKTIKLLPVLAFFILASCSSVRVNSDYDKKVNFENYLITQGVENSKKWYKEIVLKKHIVYDIED